MLISVLLFSMFAVLAFAGLFSVIETRFYEPVVVRSYADRLSAVAEHEQLYTRSLVTRFAAYAELAVVQSYLERTADDEQSKRRTDATGELFLQTPTLKGIRIVGLNGRNVHFSTYESDRKTASDTSVAYKHYGELDEVPFDALLHAPTDGDAEVGYGIVRDGERGLVLYVLPLRSTTGAERAKAVFYCDPQDFNRFLLTRKVISVYESAELVGSSFGGEVQSGTLTARDDSASAANPAQTMDDAVAEEGAASANSAAAGDSGGSSDSKSSDAANGAHRATTQTPAVYAAGLVFALPVVGREELKAQVAEKLPVAAESGGIAGSANEGVTITPLVATNADEWVLVSRRIGDGSFLCWLCSADVLLFSFPVRILLLAVVFITLYLVVFLLFSLRHDDLVVIRARIRRFLLAFLSEYLESHDDDDGANLSAALAARREDLDRELKRSLGRRGASYSTEVDALLDKNWSEILAALGATAPAATDAAELRRLLEEVLSTVKPDAAPAAASTVKLEKDIAAVEELEAVAAADDVTAAEVVEDLAEVAASDDVLAVEAVEDLEAVAAGDDVTAVEAVEELEEAAVAGDDVSGAEVVEVLTEAAASDDVFAAEAVKELEVVAAGDDVFAVEELEAAAVGDDVLAAEAVEELEESTVAGDDVIAAEAVDELEEAAVAGDDVSGAEAVEDLAEVAASDDVLAVEAVEDLEAVAAGDDVTAVEAVDEQEAVAAGDDVIAAEAVDELEEAAVVGDDVFAAEAVEELAEVAVGDDVSDTKSAVDSAVAQARTVAEIENVSDNDDMASKTVPAQGAVATAQGGASSVVAPVGAAATATHGESAVRNRGTAESVRDLIASMAALDELSQEALAESAAVPSQEPRRAIASRADESAAEAFAAELRQIEELDRLETEKREYVPISKFRDLVDSMTTLEEVIASQEQERTAPIALSANDDVATMDTVRTTDLNAASAGNDGTEADRSAASTDDAAAVTPLAASDAARTTELEAASVGDGGTERDDAIFDDVTALFAAPANAAREFSEPMAICLPADGAATSSVPSAAPVEFQTYAPDFSALDAPVNSPDAPGTEIAAPVTELAPESRRQRFLFTPFSARQPILTELQGADDVIIADDDGVFQIADVLSAAAIKIDANLLQLIDSVIR